MSIAADDPRHGSPAGYIAGCREDCCRRPRMRQQKATRYAVHAGRQCFRPRTDLDALLESWLALGLSQTAVFAAAGVAARDYTTTVRASTYDALATLTEDQLPDNATVFADLTRARARSLMAIGHMRQQLPAPISLYMPSRTHVRVSVARRMRDHFRTTETTPGTCRITVSKARNAGYQPPAAWEDPDTLAWPYGATTPLPIDEPDEVDEVVIERILAGQRLPTTTAERPLIMAAWLATGRTEHALCEQMGWRNGRHRPEQLEATG